ncbi:MAG: glucokinase [Pseudohongiellaceae bacterium]
MLALVGDIGGTRSRLRLLDLAADNVKILFHREYSTNEFDTFTAVVHRFLEDTQSSAAPDYACIAAAGPMTGRTLQLTNVPWLLDADGLSSELGIVSVTLLNDLVAAAHGVDYLQPKDVRTLQAGSRDDRRPGVILGVGTGFGQAMFVRTSNSFEVYGTEGGHVDFAPATPMAVELLQYLWPTLDHVSVETVLSGPGLERVYAFMSRRANRPAKGVTTAATITEMAVDGDTVARDTIDQFVALLAAQAGNIALQTLPCSGVYLVGGTIVPLLGYLLPEAFAVPFNGKGVMSSLLRQIPVSLILNQDVGIMGAGGYLVRKMKNAGEL